MDEKILETLAMLNALKGENDDNMGNGEDIDCITSIRHAIELFDTNIVLRNRKKCYEIAQYIIDDDNELLGSPNEYHTLIGRYLGIGDYSTAIQLGECVLKTFPTNVDLLAYVIQACGECGEFEKGKFYIEQAEKIDKKYWSWRLFLYILIFYQNMFGSLRGDSLEAIVNEALKYAKTYQKYLPADERAYNKEAEILMYHHDTKAAKEVLRKAIFDKITIGDESYFLMAQHCCTTMLETVLQDSDEYDLIIDVAKKGIKNTAQTQPSSRIGYFVYKYALAKDAIVTSDDYKNKADIIEALKLYQCAYDLNQDIEYSSTIAERYSILCQNPRNPIEDMPLIKRTLYTEIKESDN